MVKIQSEVSALLSLSEIGGQKTRVDYASMSERPKKPAKKASKAVKYCKAPQAPKRFKSAFILYTMERHKVIRKKVEEDKGKGDRTPDVAKLISEEWRNLKPEERAVWDEKARLDKERYEVEKSMYTGPWKVPAKQKKSQKDPSAPKRPMSSFLSFSNSRRGELKRKNPGLNNAEASKMLAEMWRNAPEEEKREHIEREERLRGVYKVEIAAWRERTKKEEDEKRERREEAAKSIIANRAKGYVQGEQSGEGQYYEGHYGEGQYPYHGHPSYHSYPPPHHAMYGHPPPPYGQPHLYSSYPPVPPTDEERLQQPPPPPPGYYSGLPGGRYYPPPPHAGYYPGPSGPAEPGNHTDQYNPRGPPVARFESSEQRHNQEPPSASLAPHGVRDEGDQERSQQQEVNRGSSDAGRDSSNEDTKEQDPK